MNAITVMLQEVSCQSAPDLAAVIESVVESCRVLRRCWRSWPRRELGVLNALSLPASARALPQVSAAWEKLLEALHAGLDAGSMAWRGAEELCR